MKKSEKIFETSKATSWAEIRKISLVCGAVLVFVIAVDEIINNGDSQQINGAGDQEEQTFSPKQIEDSLNCVDGKFNE